jgi:hypothetical protein
MAIYTDSMVGYADFDSTGRYFAWAMAASVAVGTTALYVGGGRFPGLAQTASDLAFAEIFGYVAIGLGVVMAIAVAGSLLITKRAKGTIIVSRLGVTLRRPKDELFLAREEILGMAEMLAGAIPRGSMVLMTADRRRRIVIPRSLAHYGDCIQELQELGIAVLPPLSISRWQKWAGWLLQFVAYIEVGYLARGMRTTLTGEYRWLMLVAGVAAVGCTTWLSVRIRRPGRPSIAPDSSH